MCIFVLKSFLVFFVEHSKHFSSNFFKKFKRLWLLSCVTIIYVTYYNLIWHKFQYHLFPNRQTCHQTCLVLSIKENTWYAKTIHCNIKYYTCNFLEVGRYIEFFLDTYLIFVAHWFLISTDHDTFHFFILTICTLVTNIPSILSELW